MLSYTNRGRVIMQTTKVFKTDWGDEQLEYQLIPAPGAFAKPV